MPGFKLRPLAAIGAAITTITSITATLSYIRTLQPPTEEALASMPPDDLSKVKPSALAKAAIAAMEMLTKGQLNGLTIPQILALTAKQIVAVTQKNLNPEQPEAIAEIRPPIFARIASAVMSFLVRPQIGALTEAQIAAMTVEQLDKLPWAIIVDMKVNGMTIQQFEDLTAASKFNAIGKLLAQYGRTGGSTDEQFQAVVRTISVAQLNALTANELEDLGGFRAFVEQGLSAAKISGAKAELFTPNVCAIKDEAQHTQPNLADGALAALTARCTA
jgi:hypothetical protein